MKIFVDSANLNEIRESLERGYVAGLTTNPSILAKEPKCDFKAHIGKIIDLFKEYDQRVPLSVEVFSTDPNEMVRQAEDFQSTFKYDNLYIKVPIGWNELKVIATLKRKGMKVNTTCCMSLNQAMMAAAAGSDYVSLFFGRIRDVGYDAFTVVQQTAELFKSSGVKSEIIVGSIRHIHDINDAFRAGAHIVTIPTDFFPKMTVHPKSTEAVNQFVTDFEKWMK